MDFVSIRRMSELFTGSTFRGWMVIVMLCYALGNCVIMGAMVMAPYYGYAELAVLAGVGLVCFNGLCMYWFVRAAFLEGDYDFREGKRKGELFLSIRFE